VIVDVPEEAHISKRLFHGSIKFCLSLDPWSALAYYLEQSSDESSGARKGLVRMASSEVSR
jgi:hypothetical protein